jgi:hypothetical protein
VCLIIQKTAVCNNAQSPGLEAKLNGPYDFFNNMSIGVSGYEQLKVAKRQFLFFSQNYQENKIETYLKHNQFMPR